MDRRGRPTARCWGVRIVVTLALVSSACLESREPAQGRHLVVDRDVASITFSHAGPAAAGLSEDDAGLHDSGYRIVVPSVGLRAEL